MAGRTDRDLITNTCRFILHTLPSRRATERQIKNEISILPFQTPFYSISQSHMCKISWNSVTRGWFQVDFLVIYVCVYIEGPCCNTPFEMVSRAIFHVIVASWWGVRGTKKKIREKLLTAPCLSPSSNVGDRGLILPAHGIFNAIFPSMLPCAAFRDIVCQPGRFPKKGEKSLGNCRILFRHNEKRWSFYAL